MVRESGRVREFLALVAALAAFGVAGAQRASEDMPAAPLSPRLEAALENASPSDPIEVVFHLELPPHAGLSKGAPRDEVVRVLRARSATAAAPLLALLEEAGAARVALIWAAGVVRATLPAEDLPALAAAPRLRRVGLDAQLPDESPGDGDQSGPSPTAPRNQALTLMEVDAVWAGGYTGKNVLVALVDAGSDWTHPDLADHVWVNPLEVDGDGSDNDGNGFVDDVRGWDFLENDPDPQDLTGHGTAMAGVVVGDGSAGQQSGVAPDAELMILRRGDTQSSLWQAFQYALDEGADLIVQGYSIPWDAAERADFAAWRELGDSILAAGVVHVNSAGNNGEELVARPIPYNVGAPGNVPPPSLLPEQSLAGGVSGTLTVGNVDTPAGDLVPSSARGPSEWVDVQAEVDPTYPHDMPPEYRDYPYESGVDQGLLKPELSAYGDGTTSTQPGGGYGPFAGTSAASAHVAGIVALLLEADPAATPEEIADALYASAQDRGAPGWDPDYGAGIVNARAAVESLTDPCALAGGDGDADTICDDVDNCPGTPNTDQVDTDLDGSGDACDPDDDADGFADDVDNCPLTPNPLQEDADADGSGDACDACPADPANDIDLDGVCGDLDNCPDTPNTLQEDVDEDGVGAACDCADDDAGVFRVPPSFSESLVFLGDGETIDWADQAEARAYDVYKGRLPGGSAFSYVHTCFDLDTPSSSSLDTTLPATGELFYYLVASQNCFGESGLGPDGAGSERPGPDSCLDGDADGVSDAIDNCPSELNAAQDDGDRDGLGDACDACPIDAANDADADGFCESADNCPLVGNPSQVDGDADGAGDACDPCPADALDDADADGFCADVDNCPLTPNPLQEDADADGVGTACDCADADPGVSGPPSTLGQTLRLPDDVTLAWDDEPQAQLYDVYKGRIETGVPFQYGHTCHELDLPDPSSSDSANPASGAAFYYLVSSENCFGAGDLGSDSGGALRPGSDSCGDGDADGVSDSVDNCPAIPNADQSDRDFDGGGDLCDACPDDRDDDADADGICGDIDNCPRDSNSDQADSDGDGTGDVCDDTPGDRDLDGVPDSADNCPDDANPDQLDLDGDGTGDVCDPDDDGDGFADEVDNCPRRANPDQSDVDGDGTGDFCDPDADSDNDGIADPDDNCPLDANFDQLDLDLDGLGDACDPDDDGDSVEDGSDNCPQVPNTDQADLDADGTGDACDSDDDADGVPDGDDNCPALANPGQEDFDADALGDPCDDDDDADGEPDLSDNCPFASNADQADADADGTGDACELDGEPRVAIVKAVQAFGAWVVGTPYEGGSVLEAARFRISSAEGAGFDAGVVWDLTVENPAQEEVRALYDLPRQSGVLFARVSYRDASGWSAESPELGFDAQPLPPDDGGLGAAAGTVQIADHFEGPPQTDDSRPDNLDLSATFWDPSLSNPTISSGVYLTLSGGSVVNPTLGSFAAAQTALPLGSANSFAVATLDPGPVSANYDFSFGLRASGVGATHTSYRCKVERLTANDTIKFNKFSAGLKGLNVATWSGDLGAPPWRIRFEAQTVSADAVELRAYVWRGGAWELVTSFLDDGTNGDSVWTGTPRILEAGQVVISNEKQGPTRYEALEAGTLD